MTASNGGRTFAPLEVTGAVAGDLTGHLQLALEASQLGTWRWDVRTGRVAWDGRLEEIYGFEPGSFPGTFEAYEERLHPDDRVELLLTVQRALATGESYQVDHRIVWPDGRIRWVQGSGRVTHDETGEVTGAIGCSMDVTDLVDARLAVEGAAAEAAAAARRERANRKRLEFINTINHTLSDAVTAQEVRRRIVRAVVPRLGDWCLMVVFDPDGGGRPNLEVAHADAGQEHAARATAARLSWDPSVPVGISAVIQAGRPVFLPDVTPDALADLGVPPERIDAAMGLGFRSVICVPLTKLGRVLGGLLFVMTDSGRRYTDDDLALATAVAGRVASALDNRHLTDQQRRIASTLQRSLLPDELPACEHVEVAVRYWAAGKGSEVGGDFYDLFPVGDGTWAAVIGDVCGTGPAAAAVTSLARHTIRLCAWRGDDPVTVLRWLNRAVRESGNGRFLTAALALLREGPDGMDLEVTLGGHPLPVIAGPDGSARSVGRSGTLLGWFPEITLHTVSDRLGPGETLVLYTDGISDVPPPHLLAEEDVRGLIGAAAAGGAGVEAVADRIDAALAADLAMQDRNDDIALLVVQVPPSPRNGPGSPERPAREPAADPRRVSTGPSGRTASRP